MKSNEYYVYRHIRKDTRKPFYIGLGKKYKKFSNTMPSEYKRAFSFRRSKHWKNIVNKAGYWVDIMMEDLTKEEAISKEVEFIKLYGRSDIGDGLLCNMTDGGDISGSLPPEIEKERRRKISIYSRKRTWTEETKRKISESKKKHVIQMDLEGNELNRFDSVTDAANAIGLTISAISKATNSEKYTAGGYKWKR